MFQRPDGIGVEVSTEKRHRRVGRSHADTLLMRDKLLVDLIDELKYKVPDIAAAFGLHPVTVYRATASFRQLVREIANRC
jgi:hypothetical protein